MDPGMGQDEVRRAPKRPKEVHHTPSRFQERPKQLQGDSSMAPRGAQEDLRMDQRGPKGTQGEHKRLKRVNVEAHEMKQMEMLAFQNR